MKASDEICKKMKTEQQRAIVATSHSGSLFLGVTCGIGFDVCESGLGAEDVLGDRPNGIHAWEGTIVHTEDDVVYDGDWRPATSEEIAAVVSGEDPFKCDECDGYGWTGDGEDTEPET